MPTFDTHGNFGYGTIGTAPSPASSGTTLSVTTGHGARFPAVTFNATIWPAGASPLASNAEIVRVTNKGGGDNWTITRTQEYSLARSIAVGDQIMLAVTSKLFTDIEATIDDRTGPRFIPGGRLSLTTATPRTTADVTAATTIYYTPDVSNMAEFYDSATTSWIPDSFAELSLAVPATTSQMYDAFIYPNSGTPALEALAWTNDTTRATALVRQNGRLVKTGATDRLWVGSFRTTGVSGQTESSFAKRYVWNAYNQIPLICRVTESANSWASTTDAWVQANASTANQLDIVVGLAGVALEAYVFVVADSTVATKKIAVGIGADVTNAIATGCISQFTYVAGTGTFYGLSASLKTYPAVGRHFYSWINYGESGGGNVVTFYGDNNIPTIMQSGIHGVYLG